MDKTSVCTKFGHLLDDAERLLSGVTSDEARQKPDPSRWSPKELLGHLIDSTANNHRRIVLSFIQDNMIFDGYDQVGWVESQSYDTMDWNELVSLWLSYNRLLLHAIEGRSEEQLAALKQEHTLDKILMKKVPSDRPATVLALIDDYLDHAAHHLKQIAERAGKEFGS